jgi:hypothetical protein
MTLNLKTFAIIVSIQMFALSASMSLYAAGDEASAQTQADPDVQTESTADDNSSKPSKWGKLLPLPIFITEPAIGYGLGAALIYFHKEDENKKSRISTPSALSKTGEHSKPPPTATALFAFYTETDTAGAGIGHSQSFADDRYRLRAALATTRINSQIYRGDDAFDFQLEGNIVFADLRTRIGDGGTFFGISTSYLDGSARFSSSEFEGLDFVDVGLAASLIYDTRDNTVLPSDGVDLELTGWVHDEAIGGDFNYTTARLKALWFKSLGKKYVISARIDSGTVDGDPPFYAFPYVRLRGIPALRYQGQVASAFELEGRRRLGDRWEVSLFTGVGSTQIGDQQVESADDIRTIGVGGRWLAFRKEDAWIGVDVARGPSEVAVYIQMGSAW